MVLFYSMFVYGWEDLSTSLTGGRDLHTVHKCVVNLSNYVAEVLGFTSVYA